MAKRAALKTAALKTLAALAALGLPSVALGQISGVRFLDVTDPVTDDGNPASQNNFALAEVMALTGGVGGTNLALGATPSTNAGTGHGSSLEDAKDGNTDGVFGNGSVWHVIEAANTNPATYTLDFGADVTLDTVRLFGRTDCCQNRDDVLAVTLRDAGGSTLFTTATGIPDNDQEITLAVPEPTSIGLLGLGAFGLSSRRRRRA